ncbi:hypothetical protein EV183_003847 [Coemansia sp. RSA 2336]|nr:hypothetical protein EV183_003847 [Coemansia sp. RSA 2336]
MQVNWLQATVNIASQNDDELFLNSTNMLFGNNSMISEGSMLLYGYYGLEDITRVEWSNLTEIGFSEITATDLLDLLQFLPNLATLKVASLDTEDMPPLLENNQYKLACSNSLVNAMLIEYPRMGIASHFEQSLGLPRCEGTVDIRLGLGGTFSGLYWDMGRDMGGGGGGEYRGPGYVLLGPIVDWCAG